MTTQVSKAIQHPPPEAHVIKLPDGLDAFAMAWQRGGTSLWVADQAGLRRINFGNPSKVTEERWDRQADTRIDGLTPPILRALAKHFPILLKAVK